MGIFYNLLRAQSKYKAAALEEREGPMEQHERIALGILLHQASNHILEVPFKDYPEALVSHTLLNAAMEIVKAELNKESLQKIHRITS